MEGQSIDGDTFAVDASCACDLVERKSHGASLIPSQEQDEESLRSLAEMEAEFVAEFLASSAFIRNGNSGVRVDGVGGFSISNAYSCRSRTSDSTDYSGDRHLDSFGSSRTPSTLTGVCTAQTDLKDASVGSMLTTTTDMAIAVAKDARSGNDYCKEKVEEVEENGAFEENEENVSYQARQANQDNEGDNSYESYEEKEAYEDIKVNGEIADDEKPASTRRCGTPPPFMGLWDSEFTEGFENTNNVINVNIIENDGLFDGFEAHINEFYGDAYGTVDFSRGAGDTDDDSCDGTLTALKKKAKELEDLFHETHHIDEENDCSVPRPGIAFSSIPNNQDNVDGSENESEGGDDDDDDGLACEFVALEQSQEVLRKELGLPFTASQKIVHATDNSVADNPPTSVPAKRTEEASSADKKGPIRPYQRPRGFDDDIIVPVPDPASSTPLIRRKALSIKTDPASVDGHAEQLSLVPPTPPSEQAPVPLRPILKQGGSTNSSNKTGGTNEGDEEKVKKIKRKNKKGKAKSAETPTGMVKKKKKKRFGTGITRSNSLGVTPPSTPTTPTSFATNLLFQQQQSSPLIRRWIEGQKNQTLNELSGFNNDIQGYDNDGGLNLTPRMAKENNDTMTKHTAAAIALPEIDTGSSGCMVPPHLMLLPQSSDKRRQQRLQRRQRRQQREQQLQEELQVHYREQVHEQKQGYAGTPKDERKGGVEERRDEEHETCNRSHGQERSSMHSSSSTVLDQQHPKEDKENGDKAEGYFQFRFSDSEEVREPQDDATTGNKTDRFSTNLNDYYYYNYHGRHNQQEHRRHSFGHDRILYNNEDEKEDLNAIEVVVFEWPNDDHLADRSSSPPRRPDKDRSDRDDHSQPKNCSRKVNRENDNDTDAQTQDDKVDITDDDLQSEPSSFLTKETSICNYQDITKTIGFSNGTKQTVLDDPNTVAVAVENIMAMVGPHNIGEGGLHDKENSSLPNILHDGMTYEFGGDSDRQLYNIYISSSSDMEEMAIEDMKMPDMNMPMVIKATDRGQTPHVELQSEPRPQDGEGYHDEDQELGNSKEQGREREQEQEQEIIETQGKEEKDQQQEIVDTQQRQTADKKEPSQEQQKGENEQQQRQEEQQKEQEQRQQNQKQEEENEKEQQRAGTKKTRKTKISIILSTSASVNTEDDDAPNHPPDDEKAETKDITCNNGNVRCNDNDDGSDSSVDIIEEILGEYDRRGASNVARVLKIANSDDSRLMNGIGQQQLQQLQPCTEQEFLLQREKLLQYNTALEEPPPPPPPRRRRPLPRQRRRTRESPKQDEEEEVKGPTKTITADVEVTTAHFAGSAAMIKIPGCNAETAKDECCGEQNGNAIATTTPPAGAADVHVENDGGTMIDNSDCGEENNKDECCGEENREASTTTTSPTDAVAENAEKAENAENNEIATAPPSSSSSSQGSSSSLNPFNVFLKTMNEQRSSLFSVANLAATATGVWQSSSNSSSSDWFCAFVDCQCHDGTDEFPNSGAAAAVLANIETTNKLTIYQ